MSNERTLLGNGQRRVIEKVENRGTFRIVGQVYESFSNQNKVLGYGIIDVKNAKLKLFTTKQTLELLKRYKFENAIIDPETGNIVNTECSMERLIKFDTKQNIIGNAGITILGQIFVDGKYDGYRILNQKGKVLDVTEDTLVKVYDSGKGIPILNAKVVSERNGVNAPYISAIKGEFKKIEKSKFDAMMDAQNSLHPSGKTVKELHDRYRKRVVEKILTNVVRFGHLNLDAKPSNKKDVKIFINEFLIPKYGEDFKQYNLTEEEVVTLYALVEIADKSRYNYYIKNIAVNTESLTSADFKKYKLNKINRNKMTVYIMLQPYSDALINLANKLNEDVATYMREVNRVVDGEIRRIDTSKSSINSITLRGLSRRFLNKLVKQESGIVIPKFNTGDLDFESTEGIKDLGYTTNVYEIGERYKSQIYGTKGLRDILELVRFYINQGENSNDILDNINCFGDLELMRKCEQLIKYAGNSTFDIIKAKAYLFVLAVNNPYLAKMVQKHFPKLDIPIDEISKEKFKLDAEDDLFYKSGGKFNRFITLEKDESWSKPHDGNGSLANFTGGYFAAMSLYLTIDGFAERGLIDN